MSRDSLVVRLKLSLGVVEDFHLSRRFMPRDPQPTKNRILSAAEHLFAANGFDGTSMRDIAARAEVQLALLHYHFGGKLDVYKAIWTARYTAEVATRRDAGFAAIDHSQSKPKTIRALVELYLLPIMGLVADPSLKDFVMIGAREWTNPKEQERGIIAEFLDPTARRFLKEFGRAMPELSQADVAWGYQFMMGTTVLHIVDRDRITRLSNGAAKAHDVATARGPLVEFCVAGWTALSVMRLKEKKSVSALRSKAGVRAVNQLLPRKHKKP
jgi:AcrR family transcriptional regulator